MTPAEFVDQMSGKEYMGYVKRLGCLLCELQRHPDTPASAHHPRKYGGLRSLLDKETIPLCEQHHVGPQGVHSLRRKVEEVYGISEEQMSVITRQNVIALVATNVRFQST